MTVTMAGVNDAGYHLDGGSGCAHELFSAADYYTDQAPGDPLGRWDHRGVHVFGLSGDIHPTGRSGEQFRAMVDRNEHPHTGDPLGRRPQHFKSLAARVAEYRAEHPHATPEQVNAFKMEAAKDQRHARNAWDINFAAPKSWSVLHTAYLAAAAKATARGDVDEASDWQRKAAVLIKGLEVGIDAALDQLFEELAYVRRGVQGPPDPETGEVTAEHVAVDNLTLAKFWHSQSRERDPHLHMHVMMLAKVRDDVGAWRKLFSPAFTKSRHMLDATFLRTAEAYVSRELGLPFVDLPGERGRVSREIGGVSREVIAHFSTRNRMLTEEAEELLLAWQRKHQVEAENVPARIRWQLLQRAWRKNRKAKLKNPPSVEEELERFDAELAATSDTSLEAVLEAVEWLSVPGGDRDPEPVEFDEADVIAQAIAGLKKATESRSMLYDAIDQRLPPMLGIEPARARSLLTRLTDAALAGPELVVTNAEPLVAVPPSLRDPRTGRSRYEPPTPIRFARVELLRQEDALVARVDHRGAPTVPPGMTERLLTGTGIGRDQQEAVSGILGCDRWLQELNAPAGAGKTFTLRKLADVARDALDARVTVFTISENAAKVVRGEGIGDAHNVAGFLTHHDRVAQGLPVSVADEVRYALPRGGIIVIDEASMMDTPQLTRVLAHADRTGSRVILVGDTAQLDAVDAGGGFAMLVEETRRRGLDVHELTTIRRFNQLWEAKASEALRTGDVTALHQYETRGRIKGDSDPEKVMDMIVKGFTDDHLAGKDAIVITGSEEEAAQVSDKVRHRLVEVGHVDAYGVLLHDKTRAGVGDIIETRQNAKKLGVLNRERWRVVGAHEWGSLDVQPSLGRDRETGEWRWGETRELPASYVAGKVELAYASTIHAFQGGTVDANHELVTPSLGRSQLYPGSTRGRDGNWLYVVTEPSAELEAARAKVTALERRFEGATIEGRETLRPILAEAHAAVGAARSRAQTPVARLASIISTDDHQPAARVEIEQQAARQASLGHLGPQWETAVRESRAIAHRTQIMLVLGDEEAAAVLADKASTRLFTLLRSAELRGRDTATVLMRAMHHGDGTWFSLAGTRSPASALYGRVEDQIAGTKADRPIPGTFESRVPQISLGDPENERLEHGRAIGRVMDDQTAALGQRQAAEPEPWVLRALGPVPEDPVARGAYGGRAALAAAFRQRYGITDQRTALGARPDYRREPERAWHWDMAARMIGMPDHDRDLAGQSRGELLNRVQDWDRVLARMPANNDVELEHAHEALRAAEAKVIEVRTAGGDTADWEANREVYRERVNVLEENAYVRALAYEDATELRLRAEDARGELDLRDELEAVRAGEPLPPEPVDPEDVEPEFDEPDPELEELRVHRAVFSRLVSGVEQEVPEVGTPEWVALGDDDPRKGLAVTQAAAAWWNLGEPREGELRGRMADAREALGLAPLGDVDEETLTAVHAWVAAREVENAPRMGTVEWADADEPGKVAGEARAALAWWNFGEPLTEERVAAAEERVAIAEVSRAWADGEYGHGWDGRSYAQVERDRGVEPDPVNVAAEAARWSDEPLEVAEPESAAEPELEPEAAGGDDLEPEPVVESGDERVAPTPELEPVTETTDADSEGDTGVDEPEVDEAEGLEVASSLGADGEGGKEEAVSLTPPEPEPSEPAVDEAEERFQAGLEWSLEQARAADPEPDMPADMPEVDHEPEPEPRPAPEPERPVPAAEYPELSEQREVAARAYEELRGREPELDEQRDAGERDVLDEDADRVSVLDEGADHAPEPIAEPEPVGDDY